MSKGIESNQGNSSHKTTDDQRDDLAVDVLPDNEVSRLRWQCRRGMLELDALLGDFVEQHYTQLEAHEKEVFKEVLNLPDQLLFDYFFGNGKSIDKDVNNVIERIRCAVTPET